MKWTLTEALRQQTSLPRSFRLFIPEDCSAFDHVLIPRKIRKFPRISATASRTWNLSPRGRSSPPVKTPITMVTEVLPNPGHVAVELSSPFCFFLVAVH